MTMRVARVRFQYRSDIGELSRSWRCWSNVSFFLLFKPWAGATAFSLSTHASLAETRCSGLFGISNSQLEGWSWSLRTGASAKGEGCLADYEDDLQSEEHGPRGCCGPRPSGPDQTLPDWTALCISSPRRPIKSVQVCQSARVLLPGVAASWGHASSVSSRPRRWWCGRGGRRGRSSLRPFGRRWR